MNPLRRSIAFLCFALLQLATPCNALHGLIAESDATAITAASGAQAGTVASTLHYGWEPNTGDSTAPLYVKRGNGTLADTDTNASTITWLHYDELGTPIRGTNRAGQIVWSARPDAAAQFGGTLISYPQGQAATTVPVINLRMAGQYFDAETGLHYNDRRYFDPASARYLSRDPIKELDPQQSLYGYALHNPVNITDPTGEVPIIPIGIAILKCAAQCAAFAALSNPCDPDFSDCGLPCLLPWNWAGPKFGKGPKGPKPGPCPVNSFTADTLVHAVHTNADGTTQTLLKRIDEMKVGELVVSVAEWQGSDTTKHETTHQTAHKTTYQPITDIITSLKEQRLITITLDSGEQIKATHSHPFLTPDGWRAAQLLQAGGQLDLKGRRARQFDENNDTPSTQSTSAEFATIANVELETTTVRVYNLEVANTHTFLVGEQGIVVHNGRGKGAGGGSGNGSGASSGVKGSDHGGLSRGAQAGDGAIGPAGGARGGGYGRNPPPPLKDDIFRRDRGKCVYCGADVQRKTPFRSDSCEFDHANPWSRGGETSLENLVTSCMPCNRSKGAKTPGEWGGRK